MQIIFVQENQKEKWDEFIASNPNGSFLQSWAWGAFQEAFGRKVWRLAVMENNEIVSAALIIKHNLLFGWNYFYCPRPIVKVKPARIVSPARPARNTIVAGGSEKLKVDELFFEEVKKIARKEKAVFLRIDSSSVIPVQAGIHDVKSDSVQARENFIELRNLRDQKIWKKTKPVQPQDTLILDISKSEEEILAQMKQKTRYNIRLAGRKGVKIKKISQPNDQEIQTFLNLSAQTSKRDKFQIHPKKYYQKMLKVLCENSMAKLFFAEYQNKIIAANIVIFFSNKTVYLHGASSSNHREAMAPYLLHWEQIKEAKKLEYQSYDFWGIEKAPPAADPLKAEKNKKQKTKKINWTGITRFKKGFGGEEISYPGSYDIILKPIPYLVYKIGKKIL